MSFVFQTVRRPPNNRLHFAVRLEISLLMSSEFEIVYRTDSKVHQETIASRTHKSPIRNISRCQANILAALLQSSKSSFNVLHSPVLGESNKTQKVQTQPSQAG